MDIEPEFRNLLHELSLDILFEMKADFRRASSSKNVVKLIIADIDEEIKNRI